MYQLVCEESITTTLEGLPDCVSGWLTQVSIVPFDYSQIDPTIATALFSGGFVLCLTPWAAAFGVSHLLRLIRY